jgi:hypothetical protein
MTKRGQDCGRSCTLLTVILGHCRFLSIVTPISLTLGDHLIKQGGGQRFCNVVDDE